MGTDEEGTLARLKVLQSTVPDPGIATRRGQELEFLAASQAR